MSAGYALYSERRVEDCWDWITPEEVTRMAMLSFEMARKACWPDRSEPFMDDGMPNAGREYFASTLAMLFELHIKSEAHSRGVAQGDFEADAALLLRWKRPASTTLREVA